ncbi:phosphoribosylformylglycinamidine cyclo-ligase [Magnetococcus marinus MC-1]|uniref:Phosphoribosylformylglycinamidine cyclo-ligase n=1 Tax=Magnetococcus marinus (strain ATCC BAA-1437 / JCM 17883 / MC-1) TaxID=156889 RepID=PUR5_MAGMM|nr:phosphoribosylformylglycinamidine cyclo-ligase [Magnetococcus marinus]A0LA23.1 RecName: Full=Phosphoribosylformylglycinamidine cyclo-ligase; AltName: Full=AIR synthase; AltName: Full=AIRS; AltName: Full=Phosphoribosyl-aminoimidazole synthetase [Magnetococcus marinus MC-1]ABK44816.1 phosphoribosylformylglycinamidine cyclo-ligase [Magnetococcus marinus MC-1]
MAHNQDASSPSGMTYRDAGVDIDAGNRLVSMIKRSVASTHRPEVRSDLGGFGALFDLDTRKYQDPVLVSATDGVGTKLKLAFLTGKHDTVGIDLVAMSVNDLVVQGAEPLFFLDYFACGKLSPETAATVVEGIATGCRAAGCALIGGETAEMPGFYTEGEYDLAGFAVGAVDKHKIIDGRHISPGDAIIGLASSGPHSNGYSLIRKLVLGQSGPGLEADFNGKPLGEVLLTPTHIYVLPLLELAKTHAIHGLVHITGGGFWENIPRILPDATGALLKRSCWQQPEVFNLLQKLGNIAEDEMLRTFNCGLGMLVIVPATQADSALAQLRAAGEQAELVGEITSCKEGDARVVIL